MSNIPPNFTWRDENGDKLECSEKLRLLHENEMELTQMTQDVFEDGLAMGVSKENMNEAMKKLLLYLAAGFGLLTLFLNTPAIAQTQDTTPSSSVLPQGSGQSPSIPAASPLPTSTTETQNKETTSPPAPATPTTPTLPMRATPETPPALLPAPLIYPATSWEGRSIGEIRILDRVTSETKELEIPVGTTVTFHRLTLRLYACNQKPAGLPADTAIRLGLSEIPLKTNEDGEVPLQRQFEGWFLAAEPAVNIYPSPLYSIQAVRCTGEPVAPKLSPLVSSKPVTTPLQDTSAPITNSVAPPTDPTEQATLTPGTPPPGNLTLPPAKATDLPFASNPAEDTSKKKKKHKHHHHEKSKDRSATASEGTLNPIGAPSATNANAAT
ncbi:DUF2155 domain-containing protein [Acetobacteraceae bacterium]|nr:DUF2155 domain-containing protein [Acetobacteraceae bacterium]